MNVFLLTVHCWHTRPRTGRAPLTHILSSSMPDGDKTWSVDGYTAVTIRSSMYCYLPRNQ